MVREALLYKKNCYSLSCLPKLMKKILQILIFITPILFLLAGQFTPITDMSHDLSEHILIGKVILESHKVISTNLFTYTNTHSPYIDYGWLTEVIFYVITT